MISNVITQKGFCNCSCFHLCFKTYFILGTVQMFTDWATEGPAVVRVMNSLVKQHGK